MPVLYGKYGDFETNWQHELSFRSVKMLNIAILFICASLVGYIIARILGKTFKFNPKNYQDKDGVVTPAGKRKLAIEILLEMGLIGICIYLARQIIQLMPFPFEGSKLWNPPKNWVGYRQKSLREWENPYPIAFFIILYQDSLKSKIVYFTQLTKF